MVTFGKENGTFSIITKGNEEDYFDILGSLTKIITAVDQLEQAWSTAVLLEEMLPQRDQLRLAS
ncbi:MAG: hypothetical protein AB2L24_11605 [Mangrovibacterium sp.]